ncbi:MAG: hypothetical protein COT37_01965 [Parcubacteria group bacterium CG08_land_8_20_14_0_20_43_9]|nr:MAG: hypothetical protein COT37_01965 [Parcubacteria group bacterium CG08_land_8_20_14_0_20_43_9]
MLLGFGETNNLLAKYKIPQAKAKIVKTKNEAVSFAKQNGFPAVLKIFSPKIIHKTDIGGVIVDIKDEKELLIAWAKIEKIAKAKKTEILIQKMITGEQIIIGAKRDSVFGPIIAFGLGGIFTEVLKDVSFRLAPITRKEARQMTGEIKGVEILKGFRGKEPVNLLKLESILLSLSSIISNEKQIREIDLNPVIANKKEALVIDAKIISRARLADVQQNLAAVGLKKLDYLFNPETIAVIGATDRPGSVGRGLVKNLLAARRGRKICLINPNRKKVFGIKTLPSVLAAKGQIDLAVIAVPAQIVPKITEECVQKGVKSVVIISSGFAEMGRKGALLQDKVKQALSRAKIAFVGPNCLGVLRPPTGLNASFAPLTPNRGDITLISQSGALIDAIIDASSGKSHSFSALISSGNEAGLTLVDFLNWAKNDPETKVIALYFEGLKNGRRFFEAVKSIRKPIVVLKGGKTKATRRAVGSHTGALAGQAEIYSAAFNQAGLIEVDSIEQILNVSKALSWQPRCKNGIAIVSNGGGAAILTADYCSKNNIDLPRPAFKMPDRWSQNNPLDIIGDAATKDYELAVNSMLKQKNVHGLIVLQTVQIMTKSVENAKIVIEAKKRFKNKPIVTAFLGEKSIKKAVKLLEKNKIPNYSDPLEAVEAMKALVRTAK